MRAALLWAWIVVSFACTGCGPSGPIGRLLKWGGDHIAERLPKTTDHKWPDMDAAEKLAWSIIDPDGRWVQPNIYWHLPADLSNPCKTREGKTGIWSTLGGYCTAGLTQPLPRADGSVGVWIIAVRQTPTEPPHKTALFHEYMHAALMWEHAPLPHHSESCDAGWTSCRWPAAPGADDVFFTELDMGNAALRAAGH